MLESAKKKHSQFTKTIINEHTWSVFINHWIAASSKDSSVYGFGHSSRGTGTAFGKWLFTCDCCNFATMSAFRALVSSGSIERKFRLLHHSRYWSYNSKSVEILFTVKNSPCANRPYVDEAMSGRIPGWNLVCNILSHSLNIFELRKKIKHTKQLLTCIVYTALDPFCFQALERPTKRNALDPLLHPFFFFRWALVIASIWNMQDIYIN